jgi:hypothetical protein
MLDLVHPIRTGWRLGSTGRHAGVDEAVGANNEHVRQIAARHPGGESFAGDVVSWLEHALVALVEYDIAGGDGARPPVQSVDLGRGGADLPVSSDQETATKAPAMITEIDVDMALLPSWLARRRRPRDELAARRESGKDPGP